VPIDCKSYQSSPAKQLAPAKYLTKSTLQLTMHNNADILRKCINKRENCNIQQNFPENSKFSGKPSISRFSLRPQNRAVVAHNSTLHYAPHWSRVTISGDIQSATQNRFGDKVHKLIMHQPAYWQN